MADLEFLASVERKLQAIAQRVQAQNEQHERECHAEYWAREQLRMYDKTVRSHSVLCGLIAY